MSFRGASKRRTRNLEIPGSTLTRRPGKTDVNGTLRMTTDPDAKLIEAGRKLFAGNWHFTYASPSIETLPPMAGLEVAREIAGKSPDAIRAAKRMLNKLSVDPGPALLAESVEQQKLLGSANQLEAVRANMEKRAPKFADG